MGIADITEALLKLGLPSLLLSWILFHWLFSEGNLGRDIGHKDIKSALKNNKKLLKKSSNRRARLFYKRWAWFGGGFYGLAGLWTFLVIETGDLLSYLSSGHYLAPLSNGLVDFLLSFLLNQLTNSIQALLWFSYWPGPGESMLIWIAAGYLGYLGGIELARRQPILFALKNLNNNP